MSRVVLILVVIAAALGGFLLFRTFEFPQAAVRQEKEQPFSWVSYTPPSGSFEVKFPAAVHHVAENISDVESGRTRRYNLYVSQDLDASIFTVTTIMNVGEENIAEEPGVLEETVNDILVANPNNRLVETKQATAAGRPALEFRIQSGENMIHGVTFSEEEMLYILTLLSNKEERDKDFQFFVDSFKVNK